MAAPHPLSSAPRPLLMLLVLVVLAWSSGPALASNMGDCSSICHRTGMLGRFAGCRCSLTLFSKRAAYGSDTLFPNLTRQKQVSEAGEVAPVEDGVAEDSIFPIGDSGFIFPMTDLLIPSEQDQLQYYQPLQTASNVAHLLAIKRNNLEQHQQLLQQQRLRQQQLQKRLQLRVAESHRVTQDNTLEGQEM